MEPSNISFVRRGTAFAAISERDVSSTLETAEQQIKSFGHIALSNPVLGLADEQRRRYDQTISKINKIREYQRDILQDQLQQFADEETDIESYSTVWESFKVKGQQVDALVGKMGNMWHAIDRLNKDAREN
mmetsp:Transcript_4616/g.8843  ORF Transcript_4616/g.8843 Transcript_4616/m.8843 type:complete len:131 (+) Transcript_4616:62-454(+)